MINTKLDTLNLELYSNLTDENLKEEYIQLKQKQDLQKVLLIAIEAIDRIFEYKITQEDLDTLKNFLSNTSLDLSYSESFYAFLLFTIIKNAQSQQIHCMFSCDFHAASTHFECYKLYNLLGISSSFDIGNVQESNNIYSTEIVYGNWKRFAFNFVNNLNIQKVSQRINFKTENAFLFDLDRIIYDYQECYIRVNNCECNVREFFKQYKNIIGVSSTLLFENKKIEFNYKIKTKIKNNSKKILDDLKNCTNKFYLHKDEKNRYLAREIEKLHKNEETVLIDVDNEEDLEILIGYLGLKKIPFALIGNNTNINNMNILNVLTPNKITIFTGLLSSLIDMKYGGDSEKIARSNVFSVIQDIKSNYFKENYKKELIKQEEIQQKNIETIEEKGGINLLFASHYTELKHEYAVLVNLEKIKLKNITFFNSPEDEMYQDFNISQISILKNQQNSDNEFLFKILSKFIFYLRKLSINKLFKQEKKYLNFSIINTNTNQNNNQITHKKIGRNEPCYCGSGLKYKNCCGKES